MAMELHAKAQAEGDKPLAWDKLTDRGRRRYLTAAKKTIGQEKRKAAIAEQNARRARVEEVVSKRATTWRAPARSSGGRRCGPGVWERLTQGSQTGILEELRGSSLRRRVRSLWT